MVYCWLAIYNHWTGLVDWTGGLDWWTDTKNHFYASNEIQMLIGLHDAPQNNLLLSLVPRPLPYFISHAAVEKKSGEGLGSKLHKTMSRTGNGGLS